MKTLRVVICILLIIGVFAMSLSVCAVDEGERVTSWEYLWAYYIYEFLSSIGINVTYQGIIEYTDEVQDTIIDWVVNYIADLIEADSQPSNYSIAQWIAPWQAEYDYWGNLRFNSTMLEDMQDFADWLKDKFSLIDNSTVVVNPVNSLSGVMLYEMDKYYALTYVGNYEYESEPVAFMRYQMDNTDSLSGIIGYIIYIPTDAPNLGLPHVIFVSTNNIGNYYWNKILFENGTESESRNRVPTFIRYNNQTLYFTAPFTYESWEYPSDTVLSASHSEMEAFMASATIQQVGDVKILTSNIVLPVDDPNYTPGDGVTIIDGVPEYSIINIDNVTVDNLPAIITQRNIPDIGNDEANPGFTAPWSAINGLIQYVAAPAGAIIALVNEAPVEGVIMLYALIGAIIIFGMIRIMREH